MSFDWQQVWQREYVNRPDERWKVKSLNAETAQTYNVHLPGPPPPSPKINKINATMFCITIDNELNLFFQQSDEKRKKTNKVFNKFPYSLHQKVETTAGLTNEQGDNYLVMGTLNQLILLKIVGEAGDYRIQEVPAGVRSIPELRAFVCFGSNRIAAVSSSHLYECTHHTTQSKSSTIPSGNWSARRSSSTEAKTS
jgi:hypothetical protein